MFCHFKAKISTETTTWKHMTLMIGWAVLVVGVASHLQSIVLQQSEELFVDQMDVWSKQLHHLTGRGGVNHETSQKTDQSLINDRLMYRAVLLFWKSANVLSENCKIQELLLCVSYLINHF